LELGTPSGINRKKKSERLGSGKPYETETTLGSAAHPAEYQRAHARPSIKDTRSISAAARTYCYRDLAGDLVDTTGFRRLFLVGSAIAQTV